MNLAEGPDRPAAGLNNARWEPLAVVHLKPAPPGQIIPASRPRATAP